MNTFVDAIANVETRTENGMRALVSSGSKNVDLFYKIGSSRGRNIIPDFVAALGENPELAVRIAQWARDVRGGAGERQLYRDILLYLENVDEDLTQKLLAKTAEIGRWDDLLIDFTNDKVREFAYDLIKDALDAGNGLAAKWLPRKGKVARQLREYFKWTPKFYRKRLVELTNVVETQMCAGKWDEINYNHVPSLASARYKKAFNRHSVKFGEYTAKLVSTDEEVRKTVKVNTGAVYPYDVLKGAMEGYFTRPNFDQNERNHILAQWDALPNYVGDSSVLPMIDVSGSMYVPVGGRVNHDLTCLNVAISLGLYMADKNKGPFKDAYLTFSGSPTLEVARGNILEKVEQTRRAGWGMNTNLHAAFDIILDTAVANKVLPEDMPQTLIIFSDMQFDLCVKFDDRAIEMVRRKYETAGYRVPNIVFWNIGAKDNVPVKVNAKGVALVSGFSPTIAKNILENVDDMSPEAIMLKTVMVPRYSL